jgi:hypothetical protein
MIQKSESAQWLGDRAAGIAGEVREIRNGPKSAVTTIFRRAGADAGAA